MKKVLSIGLSICMGDTVRMLSRGEKTRLRRQLFPRKRTQKEDRTEETRAEKTESEDTTAAAKESSIDGYVYDGEPIEIHLGGYQQSVPAKSCIQSGLFAGRI